MKLQLKEIILENIKPDIVRNKVNHNTNTKVQAYQNNSAKNKSNNQPTKHIKIKSFYDLKAEKSAANLTSGIKPYGLWTKETKNHKQFPIPKLHNNHKR